MSVSNTSSGSSRQQHNGKGFLGSSSSSGSSSTPGGCGGQNIAYQSMATMKLTNATAANTANEMRHPSATACDSSAVMPKYRSHPAIWPAT